MKFPLSVIKNGAYQYHFLPSFFLSFFLLNKHTVSICELGTK